MDANGNGALGEIESVSATAGAAADLKKARRRKSSFRANITDRLPPHSYETEDEILRNILQSGHLTKTRIVLAALLTLRGAETCESAAEAVGVSRSTISRARDDLIAKFHKAMQASHK